MNYFLLNSNQLPVTKCIPTNKLRSLERRARKRLAYFKNKQTFYQKIYDRDITSSKPVNRENLLNLLDTRGRVDFWEHRLDQISNQLAERYLLQD